jgi:hypothetical protein
MKNWYGQVWSYAKVEFTFGTHWRRSYEHGPCDFRAANWLRDRTRRLTRVTI